MSGILACLKKASSKYTTTGRDFDGANDNAIISSTPTGLSDGKQGTVSFWIRNDSNTNTQIIMSNDQSSVSRFYISKNTSGIFGLVARNSSNTLIINVGAGAGNALAANATWRHILFSWDLARASDKVQMAIDGTKVSITITTATDDAIDYTSGKFGIGAHTGGTLSRLNACLSEIFFDDIAIDLATQSNIDKFISGGKPKSLGANGSAPLGSQPVIYMPNGDPSDNKGTGGNFTITGSLDVSSTSPSD